MKPWHDFDQWAALKLKAANADDYSPT